LGLISNEVNSKKRNDREQDRVENALCSQAPSHCPAEVARDGTIPRMTTKQELPDEALSALATEWRRKALEGDLYARGVAHELEAELRRRAGAPFMNYDTLDLRPLETRTARRGWWPIWRRR